MAQITLPNIGSRVKIKKDVPDRDYILKSLRGPYGSSTRKAFKVLGYGLSKDCKKIRLKLETVWDTVEYIDAELTEPLI